MELAFKRYEKAVGVFMVFVIGVALFSVVLVGRGKDWFKSYVHYYAEFDESYNLAVNSPVKLAKAQIGKVKKVALGETSVRVDLAILEEFSHRIRAESLAMVESPTFIGSEYVSIKPGRQDVPNIEPGGEILAVSKQSLEDILQEYEVEKTAKMLVTAIQDLSLMAQELSNPQGPVFEAVNHINQSLAHIEAVMAGLEKGEGTAGGILRSDALLADVRDNLAAVQKILDKAGEAAETAPKSADHVEATLATVTEITQKLNEAMATIQKILENVEAASYDLPEITTSAKRGMGEARDSLDNVDRVVQSVSKSFLIRGNLPPEPEGEKTDAGLRP